MFSTKQEIKAPLLLSYDAFRETPELARGEHAKKKSINSSLEHKNVSIQSGFKGNVGSLAGLAAVSPSGVQHQRGTLSPASRSAFGGAPCSPMIAPQDSPIGVEETSFQSRRARVRGTTRRNFSMRALSSRNNSQTVFAAQLYSEPLAREGAGSVFPVGLPISQRRAFEVDIIERFDRLAINANVGEFWVIIDAEWMKSWVDFVMGKADPPSSISNCNMFDKIKLPRKYRAFLQQNALRSRGGSLESRPDLRLKRGLQLIKDYRAVHPVVWFIFREIYDTDGAPVMCRQKPELYTDEILLCRRLKAEEASHTKAVYELRRFVSRVKEAAERKQTS